ncbi:hypothetical protein BGI07_04070, partial [Snodgrassella alvi]|uniref:hypothetical protein n=1 Tax=Snodgrassella alvi TaxID=1196083 RepID=UPI000A0DB9FB
LLSRVLILLKFFSKFTYKTDESFELDNKHSVLILNRIISVISVLDKIKKPNSVFYNLLK